MVRTPTHRQPTHPGEMLLEEFLCAGTYTTRQQIEGGELERIETRRIPAHPGSARDSLNPCDLEVATTGRKADIVTL